MPQTHHVPAGTATCQTLTSLFCPSQPSVISLHTLPCTRPLPLPPLSVLASLFSLFLTSGAASHYSPWASGPHLPFITPPARVLLVHNVSHILPFDSPLRTDLGHERLGQDKPFLHTTVDVGRTMSVMHQIWTHPCIGPLQCTQCQQSHWTGRMLCCLPLGCALGKCCLPLLGMSGGIIVQHWVDKVVG